jgi:hypothetical protein
MAGLEEQVRELKEVIRQHNGANAADDTFVRAVDQLIDVFYDDIGEISNVAIGSLFDLFVIKVLYVGRRSTDADVVDYLGQLLSRHLYTRELFPIVRGEKRHAFYLSDLLEEWKKPLHFQNLFEAYRKYADNALFVAGVFPQCLRRWRGGRRWGTRVPFVDSGYYVSTGKTFYRLASEHELADFTEQREMLGKLAAYFEIYMDALNEMSQRYILGFDMQLIADKMLDNFNAYRRTGEKRYLDNARKYAAILKVDAASFPSLFRRQRRAAVL